MSGESIQAELDSLEGYEQVGQLHVAPPLLNLINQQVLPGLSLSPQQFWSGLTELVERFSHENSQLLLEREVIQTQLDQWCEEHASNPPSLAQTQQFLTQIGYLQPEPAPFSITTGSVDREIAQVAGPQLVVPVSNARYALNAANARWGSLYDALYGTDAIPETPQTARGNQYNPQRGEAVVSFALDFLDQVIPLKDASHHQVRSYELSEQQDSRLALSVQLTDGRSASLVDQTAFVGFQGELAAPTALLFIHNQLHIELLIDSEHPVGKVHPAGLKDVVLESAVTTIQDCEDSVAAVDASDKALVYANWLGLMRGDLVAKINKGGKTLERKLAADRVYQAADTSLGEQIVLSGRSLLLVRNVGLLMKTDAVLFQEEAIPEGILDAWVTATIALYDILGLGKYKNSPCRSVYIVKPKLHGPKEVSFTCELFGYIETLLNLAPQTLKIGIMDEERRTTVNLMACIKAASDRVIFINTGFLDRTGDEIHSSMALGPMVPKNQMKDQEWIKAYEAWNVACGLSAGFYRKAQIGKGMWAKPDKMQDMLAQKISHPKAGATCAWVPSPTAATLHAIHYHQVNVFEVQQQLAQLPKVGVSSLLNVPIVKGDKPDAQTLQSELDNNAQGILGYVVRWVDQGIGCSKVPDIHNVGLMEDRATLRISSQYIANWLYHEWVSKAQVLETLKRMAKVVDSQNAQDANYRPMSPDFDSSIAFRAACDLIFDGTQLPSGYTEPVLHAARQAFKMTLTDSE